MSRKRRKSLFDAFFGDIFDEFESFFENVGELEGGYSISVTMTPEGTVVRARVSDDVDVEEFRKMLEERYPGAKIVIEGGKRSPKIVREDEKRKSIKVVEEDYESEPKKSESSLMDILYGKRRKPFIKRED